MGSLKTASALFSLEELLVSNDPVWVWDGDRKRIAWANAPAAALWGAADLEALRARRFTARCAGIKRMGALAHRPHGATRWVETLGFAGVRGKAPLTCYMQSLDLAGGGRGLIVKTAPDGEMKKKSEPAEHLDQDRSSGNGRAAIVRTATQPQPAPGQGGKKHKPPSPMTAGPGPVHDLALKTIARQVRRQAKTLSKTLARNSGGADTRSQADSSPMRPEGAGALPSGGPVILSGPVVLSGQGERGGQGETGSKSGPASPQPQLEELDGYFTLDASGRIISISQRGQRLTGRRGAALRGAPFAGLFAPASRRRVQTLISRIAAGGARRGQRAEAILSKAPDREIPCRVIMGLLAQEDGGLWAILIAPGGGQKPGGPEAGGDLAQKTGDPAPLRLLREVSHELRNPLTVISGFAELMTRRPLDALGERKIRSYAKDIHRSALLAMDIANDLLDQTRQAGGPQKLEFKPVDVAALAGECMRFIAPLAEQEQVAAGLSVAAGLPGLMADERSLKQIFLNLLVNAIKFNKAGGEVHVSAALGRGGALSVTFRDTGRGMSQPDAPHAPQPSVPAPRSKKRQFLGYGLGLGIVKAQLKANMGRMRIESQPSLGTQVRLTFPKARLQRMPA